MDRPASAETPCTPMKSTSKCSDRIAASATGPTRVSDGVRTPPVSTTVAAPGRAAGPDADTVRWALWNTSATRTELVTTVRSGTSSNCCARTNAVVPPASAIALPRAAIRAAARAMSSFAPSSSVDFASKPGSCVVASATGTAPPCTFATTPWRARASRSRRTVMSETFSRRVSSLTRTPPRRLTSSRISARRCSARRLWLSLTRPVLSARPSLAVAHILPTRAPGRQAASSGPAGPARLTATRAGPRGTAGRGPRCWAPTAAPRARRAARPSPRRSAGPCGRCRTPGPGGSQ